MVKVKIEKRVNFPKTEGFEKNDIFVIVAEKKENSSSNNPSSRGFEVSDKWKAILLTFRGKELENTTSKEKKRLILETIRFALDKL